MRRETKPIYVEIKRSNRRGIPASKAMLSEELFSSHQHQEISQEKIKEALRAAHELFAPPSSHIQQDKDHEKKISSLLQEEAIPLTSSAPKRRILPSLEPQQSEAIPCPDSETMPHKAKKKRGPKIGSRRLKKEGASFILPPSLTHEDIAMKALDTIERLERQTPFSRNRRDLERDLVDLRRQFMEPLQQKAPPVPSDKRGRGRPLQYPPPKVHPPSIDLLESEPEYVEVRMLDEATFSPPLPREFELKADAPLRPRCLSRNFKRGERWKRRLRGYAL